MAEKAEESGSESATSISNYSNEDDHGSHDVLKDDTHPEMVPVSENEEKTTDPEHEDIQIEATKPKLAIKESDVTKTPSSSKQAEKPITAAIQKGNFAVALKYNIFHRFCRETTTENATEKF